jgi:1-acyl-sn-glycerol-3-phosphate acyltransferase
VISAAALPTSARSGSPGVADTGVSGARRLRRWVALLHVLLLTAGGLLTVGKPGSRRHRSAVVRGAARLITALGIRVQVIPPAMPWLRSSGGRLVVADRMSWLDAVALLTVVPGVLVWPLEATRPPGLVFLGRRIGADFVDHAGMTDLPATVEAVSAHLRRGRTVIVPSAGTTACGVDLGPLRRAAFQAAAETGTAVCPVVVRYRSGGDQGTTAATHRGAFLPQSLSSVIAISGLVVEVHLLPPRHPVAADRSDPAALARYALPGRAARSPRSLAAHPGPVPVMHRPHASSGTVQPAVRTAPLPDTA